MTRFLSALLVASFASLAACAPAPGPEEADANDSAQTVAPVAVDAETQSLVDLFAKEGLTTANLDTYRADPILISFKPGLHVAMASVPRGEPHTATPLDQIVGRLSIKGKAKVLVESATKRSFEAVPAYACAVEGYLGPDGKKLARGLYIAALDPITGPEAVDAKPVSHVVFDTEKAIRLYFGRDEAGSWSLVHADVAHGDCGA